MFKVSNGVILLQKYTGKTELTNMQREITGKMQGILLSEWSGNYIHGLL